MGLSSLNRDCCYKKDLFSNTRMAGVFLQRWRLEQGSYCKQKNVIILFICGSQRVSQIRHINPLFWRWGNCSKRWCNEINLGTEENPEETALHCLTLASAPLQPWNQEASLIFSTVRACIMQIFIHRQDTLDKDKNSLCHSENLSFMLL